MAELPKDPKSKGSGGFGTLSERGTKLWASGAVLDIFKDILSNTFDPDSNPKGIINVGTSENVRVPYWFVAYYHSVELIAVPYASGRRRLCCR